MGFIRVLQFAHISAIMFNLGYLPHAHHHMTTTSTTTRLVLDASLRLLRKNGIITIVICTGHPPYVIAITKK